MKSKTTSCYHIFTNGVSAGNPGAMNATQANHERHQLCKLVAYSLRVLRGKSTPAVIGLYFTVLTE
jgi:hypothetical protein